jgi:uncharacterized glyoxalase superfamily protein PhnB
MIANQSVPTATVIPELPNDDVAQASEWLCRAFGFKERLRIGAHRAQLVLGDGAVIVTARGERQYSAEDLGGHVWTFSQSIADVDPASWGGILR